MSHKNTRKPRVNNVLVDKKSISISLLSCIIIYPSQINMAKLYQPRFVKVTAIINPKANNKTAEKHQYNTWTDTKV